MRHATLMTKCSSSLPLFYSYQICFNRIFPPSILGRDELQKCFNLLKTQQYHNANNFCIYLLRNDSMYFKKKTKKKLNKKKVIAIFNAVEHPQSSSCYHLLTHRNSYKQSLIFLKVNKTNITACHFTKKHRP